MKILSQSLNPGDPNAPTIGKAFVQIALLLAISFLFAWAWL